MDEPAESGSDRLSDRWIQVAFICFAVCATLDCMLVFTSNGYRNVLGRTQGVSDITVICRITFDVAMILLYGMAYRRLRKHGISRRFLIGHGMGYGGIGLLACIPIGGYFLAPLTPIAVLYFGSFMWTPFGFFGSLFAGGAFVLFNTYLFWTGLTLKPKEMDR